MQSARFALRAATTQAHETLDRLVSQFDLTTREGYGAFLLAQSGPFAAVEAALDAAGIGRLVADWPGRRRSDALRADLEALGLETEPATASAFESEAELLGGLYVLEGSRLGGTMLLKGVPEDYPVAFLSNGNPSAWRAFVAVLDERLSSTAQVDAAAASAIRVFETFEASARRTLGADQS